MSFEMVESINKTNQGVLLQSLLTSEIVHSQPTSQVTQAVSTSNVTTCLDGRCGTLSLPVVARALGSMTNNMPFIFIPSVPGSKSAVSLVRSLTTPVVTQTKIPTTNTPEVAMEPLTIVPNITMNSSQPSAMQASETGNVSPASDTRPAVMPPIRPSPNRGTCKANFLPILPRYRTRGRSKTRNPSEAQRVRSPPPTEEEVREKVMAILGRMKEIEERQRREKEVAIAARIGGIRRATRITRFGKRSESPNSRNSITDMHPAAKNQRLESLSPASSTGETTASSQLVDMARPEVALKPEDCRILNGSPQQSIKRTDRTPSPGLDFGSGPLDSFMSAASNKSLDNQQQSRSASSMSSSGPLVRRCTCSRTGCLKLYCDCFAAGLRCTDCCCVGCRNNSKHEELRQQAIDRIVTRKPDAFLSKIEYYSENESVHTRGCNCKRSACLKNYCECYEARIRCTSRCRCQSCFNTENWCAQSAPAPSANQSKINSPQQQVLLKSASSDAVINSTIDSGEQSNTPTNPEDMDALSTMLIDRSDNSKPSDCYTTTTNDRTSVALVERGKNGEVVIVIDGDSGNFAPSDSPCTSRLSSSPTSSSSSVMPNPIGEIQGSVITSTGSCVTTTTTVTVPSVAEIRTEPQPVSPPVPLDRVWHVLSQAATPQLAQPQSVIPDPLAGLHVQANTIATPQISPAIAAQLAIPTAPPSNTLLGGFSTDSTSLLATWLVALLSGQSQAACPVQQTPTYFNPVTIASDSPSAIFLNCPTTPTFVPTVASQTTVVTATTTTTTTTTQAVLTDHVVTPSPPTPQPTPPPPQSAPDCFKVDVTPMNVACPTSNSIDASRLNGDDQYTAEELATFERLIQQRQRPTATVPISATRTEDKPPAIKSEPPELPSESPTTCSSNTEKSKKSRFSPIHRLNTEVLYLRRQMLRLTRTIRSQDRSIRALQRTIRQLWLCSDSTLGR